MMEWSTQSGNSKWNEIRNGSGWMEWSTQSGNSKWNEIRNGNDGWNGQLNLDQRME